MASEYGWSKRSILEDVYPDELTSYSKEIKKRNLKNKLRDIEVALIPNMEDGPRKEQLSELVSEINSLEPEPIADQAPELDRGALRALKDQMRSSSRLIKVKG